MLDLALQVLGIDAAGLEVFLGVDEQRVTLIEGKAPSAVKQENEVHDISAVLATA